MSLAPHLERGAQTLAVQRALLLQRYDCGRLDGKPGPRTHAALARWAADHDVPLVEAPALVVAWRAVPAPNVLVVGGKGMFGPEGVTVRNWHGGDVKRLRDAGPMPVPSAVVLHESVTRGGWRRAWDVLTRQHYGAHLMVAADGSVTQHVDLLRRTAHAGRTLNRRAVGIEILNPYYSDGSGEPGVDWIPAVWAHKGRYLLPTRAQCEAAWLLVRHLCTSGGWPLLTFPGVVAGRFLWGRVKGAAKASGVMAHHRVAHSDGLFPEHYSLMRSRGFPPAQAFAETIRAAGSGLRSTVVPALGSVVG